MEKNTSQKNTSSFSPKNQIPIKLSLKTLTNKELVTRTFSNEKKKKPNEINIFNFEAKLKSVKNKDSSKTKDNFYLFNDWKQMNFNSIEACGKTKDMNRILSNSKEKKKAEFLPVNNNKNRIGKKYSSNKLINISESNNDLNYRSVDNINESVNTLLKIENHLSSNKIVDFNSNVGLNSRLNEDLIIVGNSNSNYLNSKNKTDFSFNNS